jgi:hypothetical protein
VIGVSRPIDQEIPSGAIAEAPDGDVLLATAMTIREGPTTSRRHRSASMP